MSANQRHTKDTMLTGDDKVFKGLSVGSIWVDEFSTLDDQDPEPEPEKPKVPKHYGTW